MAVVYSSELSMANSSEMLSNINETVTLSTKLINKISSFMSESKSYLEGDVFTVVNTKLSLYVDALKKQNQICTNLIGNVKAANNTMLNYMENYDKLDDGEIEEIRGLMNQIHNSILTLESQDKTLNVSIDSDIAKLNSIYSELNKHYQKLSGLAAADNAAYGIIEGVSNDASNYLSAVKGIQVVWGGKSFYNLGNRDVAYYDQRGHYVDGEFVEWDSQWRSAGGNPIRDAGCGPTSYAIVLSTMLHDPNITPETIADLMYENGWYNGGDFIGKVSNAYGVNCVHGRFSGDGIEAAVKNGGGFIGSANNGGHYIAVTDVVYIDGQRYFVLCDPYPPFNGNKSEPTLVTEEELRAREISMDFYITPGDTAMVLDASKKPTGEVEKV